MPGVARLYTFTPTTASTAVSRVDWDAQSLWTVSQRSVCASTNDDVQWFEFVQCSDAAVNPPVNICFNQP